MSMDPADHSFVEDPLIFDAADFSEDRLGIGHCLQKTGNEEWLAFHDRGRPRFEDLERREAGLEPPLPLPQAALARPARQRDQLQTFLALDVVDR